MTYKSSTSESVRRLEFEVAITLEEAEQLLCTCSKLIEKTRIEYMFEGMLWEIDVFHGENEGLIVAEIELEDELQEFIKPFWVDKEVTDDVRYLNSNLLKEPYTTWGMKST